MVFVFLVLRLANVLTIDIATVVLETIGLISKIVDSQVILTARFLGWLGYTVGTLPKAHVKHVSSSRSYFALAAQKDRHL